MAPLSISDLFNIDVKGSAPCFDHDLDSHGLKDHVPEIDPNYVFDPEVTMALLAGFEHNRRVMVHGPHGTGKSTHVEQVAARLGWPLVRINLDGHLTRSDLVGRDSIVIRDQMQVTEFIEGMLPWSIQRPVGLLFDEFDAGRPDVMFVIQRLLERDGKFTLLDQNRVIAPHFGFRLFATTNTVGLGDLTGMYQGTNVLNQAQMDRWDIVTHLEYLTPEDEVRMVLGHIEPLRTGDGPNQVASMVAVANMTRTGYQAGDISTLMSPRTTLSWADNTIIFGDIHTGFKLSFLNKCDEAEKPVIAEYYQRAFGDQL